ncbi:MAG: hypothetical protein ACREEZ_06155 [Stellaceae bacterium]
MLINDLDLAATGDKRVLSATVWWEERDYPDQRISFEINDPGIAEDADDRDDRLDHRRWSSELRADPFLCACFPLAAVHGEARIRVEAPACPMLVEGLRTAHAWWSSWGGMPGPAPAIETAARGNALSAGPRRSAAFLSGGVDGLHMLMRNRRLYRRDDPAYIRKALFIHGFDIGKRARAPEPERYRAALARLQPVAAETGLSLVPCRTDLRHLPSRPDFWTYRHNGAALAAVAHAALLSPALLFIGASHHAANPVPMGSHPAVDGLFSSQRITIVHDGARFTRLEKVRDLAAWPTALAALRVCPEVEGTQANCGRCEKCLRTRLELLAAGVDETAALGPSLTPIEQWEEAVPIPSGHRAIMYQDLLPQLRARGLGALCRVLEKKIAVYRGGLEVARQPLIDQPANGIERYLLDGGASRLQDRSEGDAMGHRRDRLWRL